LPKEIFEAPKMGFCSPIQTWANNGFSEFAYKILNSARTINRDIWNKKEFSRYVAEKSNYSKHFNRIFLLLILELFFRVHIDGDYNSKEDIRIEKIYE
jgi:asparagine synthetase B (glutamine-hydrolysing)